MDLVVGCHIKFTEAVFEGKYPKATYSHDRTIEAIIEKESYGFKRGQHTFTLKVLNCDTDTLLIGTKIRRKGRNVYKNCEIISKPDNFKELAEDKHLRGKIAKERKERIWKEEGKYKDSIGFSIGDLDY